MPHKFGTIMSVHFILDNDSNDAPYTGSRGDVFIRISKPSKTSEKMGYFNRITVSLHTL